MCCKTRSLHRILLVSVLFNALILPVSFGIGFVAVGRLVPLPTLQSFECVELVGGCETVSM